MTEYSSFSNIDRHKARRGAGHPIFQHPDDVINDPEMSRAEKRALLASWASDARAVPGSPSLRQLEDGSIVEVDEILRALKALDTFDSLTLSTNPAFGLGHMPPERRRRSALRKWSRIVSRRRRDDDDDPPPCPALATIPPRIGGGGAFVHPEPALA